MLVLLATSFPQLHCSMLLWVFVTLEVILEAAEEVEVVVAVAVEELEGLEMTLEQKMVAWDL